MAHQYKRNLESRPPPVKTSSVYGLLFLGGHTYLSQFPDGGQLGWQVGQYTEYTNTQIRAR